jgi:recombination protein RecA
MNTNPIATGHAEIDAAHGGFQRGRIAEVQGAEQTGKTTFMFRAIASAQKNGDACAIIDCARRCDIMRAKSLGVDASRVLVSQPDNGAQAAEIIESLARSGAVDLVVVDDYAALGRDTVRALLRRVTGIAHKTNTAIVFADDPRKTHAFGVSYYATTRIELRRDGRGKKARFTVRARRKAFMGEIAHS